MRLNLQGVAPRRWRHAFSSLVVAGVLALGATGCSSDSAGSGAGHGSGQSSTGPLAAGGGGGAVTLPPSKAGKVSAVFGDVFLCTTDGEPATISDVTFDTAGAPTTVRSAVRVIPAANDRDDPESSKWMPNIARYGDPFDGKLRSRLGGTVADTVGTVISDRCARPSPEKPVNELMTWFPTTRAGAAVRSQTITYESGGRRYQLTVPWQFTICGTQLVDDDRCLRYLPRIKHQ